VPSDPFPHKNNTDAFQASMESRVDGQVTF
jgi:hypothetical protein